MVKGLYKNTTPQNTPQGYAFHAKNILLSSKYDAVVNERGTTNLNKLTQFNPSFINGTIVYGSKIITFFKDTNNHDCITLYDTETDVISKKINRTDLNFLIDHPVTGVAKLNPRDELIIAFTDGVSPPRYINLDTAQLSDSLSFYNLFPVSYYASTFDTQVIPSGNIVSGCYFISYYYISKDRTKSIYSNFSAPTYITQIDPNISILESKGIAGGKATNKAIRVTLNGLDTTYAKIGVAVISIINGVTSAKLVKEVNITSSNLTFVYTGGEFLADLTLDEIVVQSPIYTTAKHIVTLNDQLFLTDLTSDQVYDFQSIANTITIDWVSNYANLPQIYRDGNLKSFLHDEVYAFYVQFELANGRFSQAFHIPGVQLTGGDRADSSITMAGLQINGRSPKVYEVDDTCTVTSSNRGRLGKWENEDETYPPNFPNYAGQKVRHHKFPSVEYLQNNIYSGNITYGMASLDRLGVKVNLAIDPTKFKGYRVLYAKRDSNNVGVLGMSVLQLAGNPQNSPSTVDSNILESCGGNFRIACQEATDDDIIPDYNYLRFNSFDLWQERPAISNSYLRNHIKLKADKLGDDAYMTPYYGQIFHGSGSYNIVGVISNFTSVGSGRVSKQSVGATDRIRKLTSQQYVPNNLQFSDGTKLVDNRFLEETVLAKIEGAPLDLVTTYELKTDIDNSVASPGLAEETFLSTLKEARNNFFLGYENQVLVPIPTIVRNSSGLTSYQGDSFIGIYSFAALSLYRKFEMANPQSGIRNFKVCNTVGRHNPGQRYIVEGDYSTYFYYDAAVNTDQTDSTLPNQWYYLHPATSPWNQFKYSKDFSQVNSFEEVQVYNRDGVNESNFNFRTVRSTKANRESALEDGWKTFKAIDYFDSVRTKGRIINTANWGDDIFIIHHERALYRTRDKAILQTNITNISLGSGDIFELEPREENATVYGYGGTQHKFSCLLCEVGYAFVDAKRGEVFLYDGEKLNLINKGLFDDFGNYLPNCKKDNPFNDNGIVMAFDPKNYRLLVSLKADVSFTVSYSIIKQEWSCYHDYTPDYIFGTRDTLYSYKSKELNKHNVGKHGEFYGVTYPSFVDCVINEDPSKEKILAAVGWLSKMVTPQSNYDLTKTITHITIWSAFGTTGKIAIKQNPLNSILNDLNCNTKIVDDQWSFDDICNNVLNYKLPFVDSFVNDYKPIISNVVSNRWSESEPLRGKYFIIRLEFSNLEDTEIQLTDLIPDMRLSK